MSIPFDPGGGLAEDIQLLRANHNASAVAVVVLSGDELDATFCACCEEGRAIGEISEDLAMALLQGASGLAEIARQEQVDRNGDGNV